MNTMLQTITVTEEKTAAPKGHVRRVCSAGFHTGFLSGAGGGGGKGS